MDPITTNGAIAGAVGTTQMAFYGLQAWAATLAGGSYTIGTIIAVFMIACTIGGIIWSIRKAWNYGQLKRAEAKRKRDQEAAIRAAQAVRDQQAAAAAGVDPAVLAAAQAAQTTRQATMA